MFISLSSLQEKEKEKQSCQCIVLFWTLKDRGRKREARRLKSNKKEDKVEKRLKNPKKENRKEYNKKEKTVQIRKK
jgi:hypothetical protein